MSCSQNIPHGTTPTELVEWDRSSFRVPKPIHELANTSQKNQFYLHTVAAIWDGGGTYATKAGVLATWFAVRPATYNTIKASFTKLYDLQSRVINMTHHCFQLDDPQMHNC